MISYVHANVGKVILQFFSENLVQADVSRLNYEIMKYYL